jgi:outer membrane protein OmpA-like peptidoglycan-associated protein
MGDIASSWSAWKTEAGNRKISSADLEAIYRKNSGAVEKETPAAEAHRRYMAHRATQALEARVRAEENDDECVDAAELTSAYADAREEALRAVLELERNLQADLRRDLDAARNDAKSRQDELYNALSTLQGKFANIHRDARGTIVSLADILFDFNKATLRRDVEFSLVKVATILNQFGEMKIAIEGHTDSIGSEEYNLGLSQRRAQAVYDFLISQGVEQGRLTYEGFGESRPVVDNDTNENRQKNRRVDLVIQDAP